MKSKILITPFSLSNSSVIPPRLSHDLPPPLNLQAELKCPWPLRGFAIAFIVFWSFGLLVCCDDERLMTEEELLQFQARNQNYKLDIFSTTDTQPPAYPGHLDCSQPLFYFVPLSDSHSQHPAHPGNQNLTFINFSVT